MSDSTPRFARLHKDGTVSVFLTPEEANYYEGPKRSTDATFRCQVVSVADLEAERTGDTKTLPWLRHVDRRRAIQDLHRMDADRAVLEHVASTPVASFTPSRWNVITMVRGAWETDEPFHSDLICASGGAVYDAVLPIGGDVEEKLRAIPADDPRRRERATVLLNQHDDGLPPD